ncbi:MAG: GFA family protein [Paracoccaceae bacterium]
MSSEATKITGRCYCGAVNLAADTPPLIVVHCHCSDCRRWTGGAVGTFAAFDENALHLPANLEWRSVNTGVERSNCSSCGSPLTARFAYLPRQIYVPVGVLDQASDWPPALHCHADSMLDWLHIPDGLPRDTGTGRGILQSASESST